MGVTGGTKVIKYLLFVFNLLFLLCGFALIIIGSIVTAKLTPYNTIMGVSFNGIGVFLIVIGGIVSIIAFLGCCGAYKESYCMLITFIILMIIMLLAVVTIIIAAFVVNGKLFGWLSNDLRGSVIGYNVSTSSSPVSKTGLAYVKFWDDFQESTKCCGISSYMDWGLNVNFNNSWSVPDSCCNVTQTQCGKGQLKNPTKIYTTGCVNQINIILKHNLVAVGGAAAALGILMLLGMIFAGCLIQGIRGEYNTV